MRPHLRTSSGFSRDLFSLLSSLFSLLSLLLTSQIALRTSHFELRIRPSTPLPTASTLCGTIPGPAECAKRLNNKYNSNNNNNNSNANNDNNNDNNRNSDNDNSPRATNGVSENESLNTSEHLSFLHQTSKLLKKLEGRAPDPQRLGRLPFVKVARRSLGGLETPTGTMGRDFGAPWGLQALTGTIDRDCGASQPSTGPMDRDLGCFEKLHGSSGTPTLQMDHDSPTSDISKSAQDDIVELEDTSRSHQGRPPKHRQA